jgi:hypothetical protein
MPPRKQPPQQDPEEEDDALVTSKQFKEMIHMMETMTASMNETFDKATTSMNEMSTSPKHPLKQYLSGCTVVLWLWLAESRPWRLGCQLWRLTQMLQ